MSENKETTLATDHKDIFHLLRDTFNAFRRFFYCRYKNHILKLFISLENR